MTFHLHVIGALGLNGAAIAIGLLIIPGGARGAETSCNLSRLLDIETTLDGAGSMLVPTMLDGKPAGLVLDTGAVWSVVKSGVAGDLPRHRAERGVIGAGGVVSNVFVTVPTLQIGPETFQHVDFYIEPDQLSPNPAVAGNLAANVLTVADLEIDPAGGRLALFARDHCPGRVIYWPHRDLIRIPFQTFESGLITIPVEVDGHALNALIDTGASVSILYAGVARRLFGLDEDSPGLERAGSVVTIDGKSLPIWRHQFQTLTIGDATFKNPWLTIAPSRGVALPDSASGTWHGTAPPDLVLGMHQLRELHMFFAYGERMLYATTVAGDAAAAAGRPAGEPGTGGGVPPPHPADWLDYTNAKASIDSATKDASQGRHDQAIADLDRAIRIAPGLAMLYADRGNIYLSQHDYPAALADFDRAVALAPADAATIAGRGFVRLAAGQTDGAAADFGAALKIQPANPGALYGRSILRGRQGDQAGSAADLAAAERADPDVARHYPLM